MTDMESWDWYVPYDKYVAGLDEERKRMRADFDAGRGPGGDLLPAPRRESPAAAIRRVHEAAVKESAE